MGPQSFAATMVDASLISVRGSCFAYTDGIPGIGLVRSVRTLGLINPPILAPAADGRYLCVAGAKRVRAWRKAGRGPVPARVVGGDVPVSRLFRIALEDNSAHRELDLAERARFAAAFLSRVPWDEARAAGKLLPALGLPPSPPTLSRLVRLASFPPSALRMAAGGRLHLKTVDRLSEYSPADLKTLSDALEGLGLGVNKTQQWVDLCRDVEVRTGAAVGGVLSQVGALPPPPMSAENRPQLLDAIFSKLHALVHPALATREKRFALHGGRLTGGLNARVTHHPFFEKGEYHLDLVFHSPDEWRESVGRLSSPESLAAVRGIFERVAEAPGESWPE